MLYSIHKLIRTPLCIMAIVASLIGAYIAYHIEHGKDIISFFQFDPMILFLGTAIPFLMISGSNAINDLVDYEGDKKNNRVDRPLVTSDISFRTVKLISILGLSIGPIMTIIFNRGLVTITVLLLSLLSVSYSLWLKKTGFVGNCVVALSQTSPFILGAVIISSSHVDTINTIAIITMITFIGTLSREIAKGIMDVEGDRAENVNTIAVRYGVKNAAYLSIALQIVTMFLFPLPIFFGFKDNIFYLIAIILPISLIIFIINKLLKDQSYETGVEIRKYSRFALYTGIFAFIIGVF